MGDNVEESRGTVSAWGARGRNRASFSVAEVLRAFATKKPSQEMHRIPEDSERFQGEVSQSVSSVNSRTAKGPARSEAAGIVRASTSPDMSGYDAPPGAVQFSRQKKSVTASVYIGNLVGWSVVRGGKSPSRPNDDGGPARLLTNYSRFRIPLPRT